MSHPEDKHFQIGGMGSEIYDKRYNNNETGWDRIKSIFYNKSSQDRSAEGQIIIIGSTAGLATGIIMGGMKATKFAREDFIRKNKDFIFLNPAEAKRLYMDKTLLAAFKGGSSLGLKLGLFTGGYCLISTMISAYRNAGGFLEHVIAGSVVGSMVKFNMGPKGMIAGGLIGMTLGCFAGTISSGLMWLNGTSIEEIRYWQHSNWETHLNHQKDLIRQKAEKEENKKIQEMMK